MDKVLSNCRKLAQSAVSELLKIPQPRVCALLQGKEKNIRLDSLVDMAQRFFLYTVTPTPTDQKPCPIDTIPTEQGF